MVYLLRQFLDNCQFWTVILSNYINVGNKGSYKEVLEELDITIFVW